MQQLDSLDPVYPSQRSWRRPLSLVLLCLFLAGLYASTLGSFGMLGWDEAEYASLGRSVLRGEGFSISGRPAKLRLPLLPLAVAAGLRINLSNQDVAARLPSVGFGILALLVVYGVMRSERDHLTGWIAAAFLGLMPTYWQFTSLLLTEIPFMAFFTVAIACFYFGLYRDERFFYGSWAAVGLAILTRYTAVLFAPIALCFTLFALTDADARRRIGRRHFWLSPLLGLALMLPWLLRQQLVFGNALAGFRDASHQLQDFLPQLSMPWYYYPAHLPDMISPVLCIPFVVGIVWAVDTRDRFGLHCLFVIVLVLLWFSAYRFKEVRMATSILPFIATVAALGVTQAILRGRPLTKRWTGLLAVFLMAFLTSSFVANRQFFSRVVAVGYPSFTTAMRDLVQRTPSDAVLMGASVPQISWYTDRTVVDFPRESDLLTTLEHCDWVIVTNFERSQKPYVGQLLSLVAPKDMEDGNAAAFHSGEFSTVLIRASLLRQRL